MLFGTKSKDLTDQAYRQAVIQANNERKDEVRRRLDFYHDDQVDYLKAALQKHHVKDAEKLTPCFINIVKKIINNLSMVYVRDAKREIDGSDRDKDFFNKIARTTSLAIKMKLASRYTKLLKTVLLRPVWRNGKMDLDILTGDVVDVVCGDVPEDIQSVMIAHYPQNNLKEELEYSLWTLEEVVRLDYRGRRLESEPNPYGIIPFVPCWDRVPTSDFWIPGGDDLIVIQNAINEKLTDLLYTLRMQGFGVGWAKGMRDGGEGGTIQIGPGTMFDLPADGGLGFESTKAPIDQIVDAIEFLIKQAAVSNGLPASSLSTEPTEESGVSKIVSNRDMDERRRDDVALWVQYEHQLFDIFRTIWNVHNPIQKIGEKTEIFVDFYDPRPEVDPSKQAETWLKLLDKGLISKIDIVQERNPDLKTREQAKDFLKMIVQERAEFPQEMELEILMKAKDLEILPREVILKELFRRGILTEELDPVDVNAIFERESFLGSGPTGEAASLLGLSDRI